MALDGGEGGPDRLSTGAEGCGQAVGCAANLLELGLAGVVDQGSGQNPDP